MRETEQRVTAIEPQRRNPDRVNIFLNGEFAFGLPISAVVEHGLKRDLILTPDQIAELRKLDETAKATDTAIRLLANRPRSVSEITRRLRENGCDDAVIERVIARLTDWNYVDDEAFAKFWVENREANRPRGKRMLEHELRMKGVDREVVASALDSVEIDEFRGALEIANNKSRAYACLDRETAKRRLSAFLTRRGYGYGVIKQVLEELYFESGIEEENPVEGVDFG